MKEKYFLTGDVAKACNVSGNTIRWWIYKGFLDDVAKDTSKRRIFTQEDLDRFVVFAQFREKDKDA